MDRLTKPCVVLVVLLLAGLGADAATIRGVPGCGYWLRDREPGGARSYFNAMWLVGYLSGAAVHSEKDILRTIDSESIADWMDSYCKANPSRNIAEGGEMLFDEIVRHAPADKTTAALTAPTPNPPLAEPPPPAMPLPSLVKLTAEVSMPLPTPAKLTAEVPMPLPAPAKLTAEVPMPLPAPAKLTAEVPMPLPVPAKLTAEVPAEPGMPQSAASPAAAVNAATYLPRALMLANTLPLTNSRYQFKAEQFAKANGCVRPAATMSIRTATSETFAVSCADGAALSIRCDPGCRDLQ
jgi:hypothetical protein